MANKKSSLDRLTGEFLRNLSESKFLLYRNFSFGSAAACLVVLSQIIQVGANEQSLEISVIAAAIGMPLWVAIGIIYEFYISLGKRSYPHFRSELVQKLLAVVIFLAGVALLTSIGGVIWYLSKYGVIAFVASMVISCFVAFGFMFAVARWWYGSSGPGGKENESGS